MENPVFTCIEAEQYLIGALLSRNNLAARISRYLKSAHFFVGVHARIYELILAAIANGSEANAITLKRHFEGGNDLADVGGSNYLAQLEGSVLSYSGIEDYANSIIDAYQRREINRVLDTAKADISCLTLEKSAKQVSADITDKLSKIRVSEEREKTINELVAEIIADTGKEAICTPTGLSRLDNAFVGGLHAGRFYAFAARMKAGKTTLMATLAYNIAQNCKGKVLYICLEMTGKEIMQRILARHIGCNSLDFIDKNKRNSQQMAEKYKRAVADFSGSDYELSFEDAPSMSLQALLGKLADVGSSGKYIGVFIDYLQLVTGMEKGENESGFQVRVAQSVAEVVKRYPNMWIVTAVQLNRDDEIRGSDGVRMACDMLMKLSTVEVNDGDGTAIEAWMEMLASRFTPFLDIGCKDRPALRINRKIGPYYEEI